MGSSNIFTLGISPGKRQTRGHTSVSVLKKPKRRIEEPMLTFSKLSLIFKTVRRLMIRTASFLSMYYVPAHVAVGYSVLPAVSAIQVSLVTAIPVFLTVMTVLLLIPKQQPGKDLKRAMCTA